MVRVILEDAHDWWSCSRPRSLFRAVSKADHNDRRWWLLFFNYDLVDICFAELDNTMDAGLLWSIKKRLGRIAAKSEAGFRYADGRATVAEVFRLSRDSMPSISADVPLDTAYSHAARELDVDNRQWLGDSCWHFSELIRDVLPCPFTPLDLVCENGRVYEVMDFDRSHPINAGCTLVRNGACYREPAWLNATVRNLALAAYEERVFYQCQNCHGAGVVDHYLSGEPWQTCPCCQGDGKGLGKVGTMQGTLDPDKLLILADAMEEYGCTRLSLLNHLRGLVPCPGFRSTPHRGNSGSINLCNGCDGSGFVQRRFPHVRGCHVVDAILNQL